jgi:hypothetical protein
MKKEYVLNLQLFGKENINSEKDPGTEIQNAQVAEAAKNAANTTPDQSSDIMAAFKAEMDAYAASTLESARAEASTIIANAKKEAEVIVEYPEKPTKPRYSDDPVMDAKIAEHEAYMHEMVEVELFYDGEKYSDDLVVAVNGKAWQIKRGETVTVPRFVKEAIDNSLKQDRAAAKISRQFQEQAENRFKLM